LVDFGVLVEGFPRRFQCGGVLLSLGTRHWRTSFLPSPGRSVTLCNGRGTPLRERCFPSVPRRRRHGAVLS
jgi:hypothetical protein